MLNQQTIEKLHAMKLHGLADAFIAQLETTESHGCVRDARFRLNRVSRPKNGLRRMRCLRRTVRPARLGTWRVVMFRAGELTCLKTLPA